MHATDSIDPVSLSDAPERSRRRRGRGLDGPSPDGPGLRRVAPLLAALALAASPATADGSCTATATDTDELISAIETANSPDTDCDPYTIQLSENTTYTLTEPSGGPGLPTIESAITIQGNGSTIERQRDAQTFRIFYVDGDASLTLQQLTLSNGQTGGSGADGGAVKVAAGGSLSVEECTFENNEADKGGAISVNGSLSVSESIFTNNRANRTAGGGIYATGVSLSVERSTLGRNVSSGGTGGAIRAESIESVEIVNSTFHENSAALGGGAAALHSVTSAEIDYSTFVNNDTGGNEAGNSAGALKVERTTQGVISNSIFKGNEIDNCYIDGGSSTSLSFSHNISSDETCACTDGCQTDTDPLLSELGYYGGYTRTYAPQFGCRGDDDSCSACDSPDAGQACSPVLNQIPYDECGSSTDQRGSQRPNGMTCQSDSDCGRCDIGSYEAVNVPASHHGNELTISIRIDDANDIVTAVNDSSTETDTLFASEAEIAWELTPGLGSTALPEGLAIDCIVFLEEYRGNPTDPPCYLNCGTCEGVLTGACGPSSTDPPYTVGVSAGSDSDCQWPSVETFHYYRIDFNQRVGRTPAWDPRLRIAGAGGS